jgi:hypothetical protein
MRLAVIIQETEFLKETRFLKHGEDDVEQI